MTRQRDWKHVWHVVLLTIVLLPLSQVLAQAAPQKIVCPAEMVSSQISVSSPPGWAGFYLPDSKLKLQDARTWWGPLKFRGVMIGESAKLKDGSIINKFGLVGGEQADWPELDKWMVCDYGDNIYQAIKLPSATKECAVTFRRDGTDPATRKSRYVISDITCS